MFDDDRVLGMTAPDFVDEVWGQRPLLVRGAFDPDDLDVLSPEQLAGLSLEEDIVSRFVMNEPPDDPSRWTVEFGPFVEQFFEDLPERNWTILVQEAERHVPEVATLLAPFRFIPNWRFDDIMVSYAVPGGGVGPHYDRYDVFLIQGRGSRHWRVGGAPIESPVLADHDDLLLLSDFVPEYDWSVAPGDLIYLPPMFAHEGTATTESLTFSVGFRMPSVHDIILGYVTDYLTEIDPARLLRVRLDKPASEVGLLDRDTLDAVRSVVRAVAYDEEAIDAWFGRYISGKARVGTWSESAELPRENLETILKSGARLQRMVPTGIVYTHVEDHDGRPEVELFANGTMYRLPAQLAGLAPVLAGSADLNFEALSPWLERPGSVDLLTELINAGNLVLVPAT